MENRLSFLVQKIGIEPGPRPLKFSDSMRVSKSDRMVEETAKRRRKVKTRQRANECGK